MVDSLWEAFQHLWKSIYNNLESKISIPRCISSKNLYIRAPKDMCKNAHCNIIFNSKKWKQLTNLWCSQNITYHTAIKRDERQSHTIWMNLKNTVLRKEANPKHVCCMILFIWSLETDLWPQNSGSWLTLRGKDNWDAM